MIQGPLLPAICAIFFKIFGQEMLVTRFLAIILDTTVLMMSYKIMDKLGVKDYIKYIILLILGIIMKPYFTIDYNWASLLLVLVIIYMEISSKKSWKKEITLGIIAGITITLKQTTGLIIVLAVLGWGLLQVRNLKDFKDYIKTMLLRLLGVLIVICIFAIILIKLGAIEDYIDYCILGITTFSNKISYVDALIKKANVLIKILSIVPILIYFILIYNYIKTRKKEFLILFTYSMAQLPVVYPISDEAHFVLAITPTLIGIGYLLNLLDEKIKIPKKGEFFANTFMGGMLLIISATCFMFGIKDYKSQNINFELAHFKYLPLSKQGISNIKEIDNFIISQNKNVYILDASAALYMIPIDRYNKDYDMFNKGNLGSGGEEKQIEKLRNLDNRLILIKNEKYNRNWQNPEKVRSYVISNMSKIGEIGIFDIYE